VRLTCDAINHEQLLGQGRHHGCARIGELKAAALQTNQQRHQSNADASHMQKVMSSIASNTQKYCTAAVPSGEAVQTVKAVHHNLSATVLMV
jgi:hypothetical protein